MIGVDLGGTNVRVQAISGSGEPAGERFEFPSNAQGGIGTVIDAVSQAVAAATASASLPVSAVGVAVAGHVDDRAGVVRWSPNFGHEEGGVFRYWSEVPFRELLGESVQIPIHLGNDANLAALGEYLFGSGKNQAKCLVMLTVGTGIGGGVVMAPDSVLGRASGPLVLVGGNMGGAELGHTVVSAGGLASTSGAYGSVEAYCQRDSIVRRSAYRLQRGRDSILRDMTGGDYSNLSPRMLTEAADRGDALAIEVWSEVGYYLGLCVGNMINVFAPDVFAIGGQIAKAGKWLLDPAIEAARNVAIPTLFKDARIVPAELIEDAGLLGGAALALESTKWA